MAREALVGRADELALADRFFDRVEGGPAAFLIKGEAGIGKTALWAEVAARAEERGFRVLRAVPAESEAELSYVAIGDVVEDVFDEAAEALPAVQRRALAVALGRVEPDEATDARLIVAASLGLLDALSREGSLVVAIDDVQWLDRASLRALEFAARRARGRIGWLRRRQRPRLAVAVPQQNATTTTYLDAHRGRFDRSRETLTGARRGRRWARADHRAR